MGIGDWAQSPIPIFILLNFELDLSFKQKLKK